MPSDDRLRSSYFCYPVQSFSFHMAHSVDLNVIMVPKLLFKFYVRVQTKYVVTQLVIRTKVQRYDIKFESQLGLTHQFHTLVPTKNRLNKLGTKIKFTLAQNQVRPLNLHRGQSKSITVFQNSGNPVFSPSSAFTSPAKFITTPDKLLKPCNVVFNRKLVCLYFTQHFSCLTSSHETLGAENIDNRRGSRTQLLIVPDLLS